MIRTVYRATCGQSSISTESQMKMSETVELPAPLDIITPNSGWELIDTTATDESISTTYAYTELINPGEKIVLCDYVQMQGILITTFANIEDFQLNAEAYLFATDDLEDMTWPERWEKIKDMIQ